MFLDNLTLSFMKFIQSVQFRYTSPFERGYLHLLYRQYVDKRDGSVYLDEHVLFSQLETILPTNMEITTITYKEISIIKAHVNDQNVLQLMYRLVVQLTLSLGGQLTLETF